MDQSAVLEYLGSPGAFGHDAGRVERIETHVSVIFLTGTRAYKLKRAVRLPYLDYSTLDQRRLFCEKEVTLNRRTAPDLYLGVVPVTRSISGMLAVGGTGTPVEWLIEMRRFDQSMLLDALARRGELGADLCARVGTAAARLHEIATPRRDLGGTTAMQWVVDDNDAELAGAGESLPQRTRMQLHDAACLELHRHGALLDARRDAGWVRECHGDLHLRNIFLSDGHPVLFDGIEFSDAISCIDVLYDVAFLVSDLLHRDLPAHANRAMNAWLERLPQYDALALLPLFLSCRAAVRAKVLMSTAAVAPDADRTAALTGEASTYLEGALALIGGGNGAIVAIGGLSGSGKSSLALRLAPDLGRAPGGIVLRSDVNRKRRFRVSPTDRLPDSAYDEPITLEVYREIIESARNVARAGFVAIVDAVFGDARQQKAVQDAAEEEGVPFVGLWLDAPLVTMEQRLAARTGDVSDATSSVLHRQHARASAPAHWEHIDATRAPGEVAEFALASIVRVEAEW
jgi:aminoglycoside phosphotransferase family enzyme/predicted kinase